MKSVLLIAYHYPPLAGSSGVQRALRFSRYLPEFGWRPVVLTTHTRAYDKISDDQIADIPGSVEVIRAPAWDSSRHFSIGGRYPGMLARPDRWASWWIGGSVYGMRAIRRFDLDAIWSTYPIASAHLIGATLARRSRLPWIADFRDPMVQPDYPSDPAKRASFERTERAALTGACFSTFTTPGAVRSYRERYPECAHRMHLLENGYDEESFAGIEPRPPLNASRLTLLHSGIVYPSERDPTHLVQALASLKAEAPDAFSRLRIRFRAPVHEKFLRQLAQQYLVTEAIEIMPPIAYREALSEMLAANGLLILQASNCNEQIPAKIYEYFRAGRPLVVLADPSGDTAGAARKAGIEAIAGLDDIPGITNLLSRFVEATTEGTLPSPDAIANASRRSRTGELARLLDLAVDAH